MACDDGQEAHLLALAEQLNATIQTLRGSFGEIGDQRLTVMAAITLADDLSEAQRQIRRLEAEIQAVKENGAAMVERYEAAEAAMAQAVSGAAKRIGEAVTRLNARSDSAA
jgi:cell division protein ZapA